MPQTRYQAAHEAVHVLCGLPPSATGLEEGVAVVFSEECMKQALGIDPSDVVRDSAKYKRARDLVRQLIDDGADIKALRTETGGQLSGEITPENIPTPETYRGNVSCTGPTCTMRTRTGG